MDAVRIALFPLGSAGDVHPFIGLGQALKRRGHEVAIMVNGYFRESVQRIGLEYFELGTAEEYLAVARDPRLWRPIRSFGSVFHLGIARFMPEQYAAVTQHFLDRRTLLLANCLSFGVRIAAEKYGLPLMTIHIQPAPLWSEHQAPRLPYLPSWAPRWYKRAVFRIGQRLVVDRMVGPITNRFRAEVGLPPMRHTIHWWNSPDGVLCLFPPWYAPRQPDWPTPLWFSKFPLWDESDLRPVRQDVEAFLDAGEPPLVFAPGSANCQAQQFFAAAVDACQRLGRRGVLLTAFAEQIPQRLPETVRHFDYVPFSHILPRSAALIHHGGIGTTSQGLRAGVCHLVMPMAHDQPDNAARLQRLGVGDWLRPARFRGPDVADKLDRLLQSEQVAHCCQQIAAHFSGIDPLAEACRVVEQMSELQRGTINR
jgi:rhamnosyltransferase subunit B